MSTYATKAKDVQRRWFLVDADGATLGRLASEVAYLLRGKHNPLYVPYLDTGDHVVIVNASRVRLTGRKLEDKYYYRHTGYPGGARTTSLSVRMATDPGEVIRDAVKGMLPKGPLGRQMIRKVRIYNGPAHEQAAQKPIPYPLGKAGKGVPAAAAE
jgi:large subunit ribosomal protein L13